MWKVLKDYITSLEFTDFIESPKSVLKFAFKNSIIKDENIYLQMLNDRNSTIHIYDENLANSIYENIKKIYMYAIEDIIKYLDKNDYLKLEK